MSVRTVKEKCRSWENCRAAGCERRPGLRGDSGRLLTLAVESERRAAPQADTLKWGDHIKDRPISHVSDVLRHYRAHLWEQSSLSSLLSVSGLQGLLFFFFL